jgi:CTP synthase
MHEKDVKFVVVSGGVLSGLGKGLFISSLGKLLRANGYKVTPIKIDPYMNVDAGTMNPIEHGEVFVLNDGAEVDMDLGNYERFMDLTLTKDSNITTGKIFKKVIERERKGDYLGKTVQLIPHVTGELKKWYKKLAKETDADIILIEIGGTVGDIENKIFLESVRELSMEKDVFFVHCSLVPVLGVVGEQKTKPTQQSIMLLREMGIMPNMIFCRSKRPLQDKIKEKVSLFCGVEKDYVISGPDLKNIYEIPIGLESQAVGEKILAKLNLYPRKNDLEEWKTFVENINSAEKEITIAITGKYVDLKDSYASIKEALLHASGKHKTKVNLKWVETTDIEEKKINIKEILNGVDGIIVPGGFGIRGAEGKIKCIKYARENDIPFLGICFGFQLAVVEFARNICNIDSANSTEIDSETPNPVISIIEEQKSIKNKGGTMRLGKYPAVIARGSKIQELYNSELVYERHRHRFEVNPDFIGEIEGQGMHFSGKSPDGKLMEFLEIPEKTYFVATQAHPELTSRPLKVNPLFSGLVEKASKKKYCQE